MKSKYKSLIFCLLAVIFSAAFFLTIIEAALRAGIVKNQLRDQLAYAREKTNSKHKILIIGDSFAYIIQDLLSRELIPYNAKVLNTAAPGMGPFEYAAEMKARGMIFKPDITVLFYYTGNDLTDIQYDIEEKDSFKNRITNFIRPLSYNLYLYHFYKEKKNVLFPKMFDYSKFSKNGIDRGMVSLAKAQKVNPWLLELSLKDKDYLLENILIESEDSIRAWDRTKELLGQIQALCNKLNSEFVIVIFPSTVQVNKSHYAFYKSLMFNIDDSMTLSNRPQALLRDFCEEKKIHCLDLLPYFKAEPGKELYTENDDHLNEIGNTLSARIIKDFLIENTNLEANR